MVKYLSSSLFSPAGTMTCNRYEITILEFQLLRFNNSRASNKSLTPTVFIVYVRLTAQNNEEITETAWGTLYKLKLSWYKPAKGS